jgi:hypothetical protein
MTEEIRYTAQLQGSLKLSRTGEWWHEGRPFENQRLAALFHRSIVFDESLGSFVIRIGTQQAIFDLEDTALFVDAIEATETYTRVVLNDGRSFLLSAIPIFLGSEDQIYVLVPRIGNRALPNADAPDAVRARLSRGAHQVLLQHLQDDGTLLIDGQTRWISSLSALKDGPAR